MDQGNYLMKSNSIKDSSIIKLVLGRASGITELDTPNSKGENFTFKEIKKKDKNHQINKLVIRLDEFLENVENYSPENSFDFTDKLNKKKEFSKFYLEEKIEFIEKNNFINENDLFFDEILRVKILEKIKKKYSILKLVHLDILKIPTPSDLEFLKNPKYFAYYINEIKNKIEGNFCVGNFCFEICKKEDLITLVNKKDLEIDDTVTFDLGMMDMSIDRKIIREEIFVGIRIIKVSEEIYYIYYLYATY